MTRSRRRSLRVDEITEDAGGHVSGGATALVVGVASLWINRLQNGRWGGSSIAFDTIFLSVVALVIATGVLVEAGRFLLDATLAVWLDIVHLGAVLCWFIAFPYSKFAHMLYRTLALVHVRMVAAPSSTGA